VSEIKKHVAAVEADPTIVQSPLEQAVEFKPIQDSADFFVKSNLDILNAIDALREEIRLPTAQTKPQTHSFPHIKRPSEIYDVTGVRIEPNGLALSIILDSYDKPGVATKLLRLGFRSDEIISAVDWAANEYSKAVQVYEKPVRPSRKDPFAEELLNDPFADALDDPFAEPA
jgi:hypothetical protein